MTTLKKKSWSPFFSDPFFRDFDSFPRFFDRDSSEMFPAVNVINEDKDYIIELAVPGYSKDDFTVDIEDNMVVISAEKKEEKESREDKFTRREFSYNEFKRSFMLPDNVDESSINAKYKDGVLRLVLMKKELPEAHKHRKIDIK